MKQTLALAQINTQLGDLVTVEIDLDQLHRTRARLPLLRDERTALVQRERARITELHSQTQK
ncbi:MAG: hypothetical protein ISS57_06275 [Anaerolineales bacterium]|nr:hypothetical protein [Anaerolineales bacterium]